jgi:sec-independent protein translocase protein TatB
MFDLGWMELLIIGVTALIVVGPKDLPVMFKTVGNFVGKAKRMAGEFKSTMEAAADETGLKEGSDMLKTIDGIKDPVDFFKNEANNARDPETININSNTDEKYQATNVTKKVKTSKT